MLVAATGEEFQRLEGLIHEAEERLRKARNDVELEATEVERLRNHLQLCCGRQKGHDFVRVTLRQADAYHECRRCGFVSCYTPQ